MFFTFSNGLVKSLNIDNKRIDQMPKGGAPDVSEMNARVRRMVEDTLISSDAEEIFKLGEKGRYPRRAAGRHDRFAGRQRLSAGTAE